MNLKRSFSELQGTKWDNHLLSGAIWTYVCKNTRQSDVQNFFQFPCFQDDLVIPILSITSCLQLHSNAFPFEVTVYGN